jgi:hypothetical protein
MAQEVVKERFTTVKTKSGIEIRYEDESHSYWVRDTSKNGPPEWTLCDFSMSGVADCLAKDGLTWWGMKIGLAAVPTLIESQYVRVSQEGLIVVMGETQWELPTMENLLALTKKQKLTVNHIRDKAGVRGNSVHTALERWVKDGTMPVPEFYPPEETGYVVGLNAFLTDLGEIKSKPQAEIVVGSVEHRIAGRYDLEMVLHEARLVTKMATPSWTGATTDHHSAKGPVYTEFNGRTLFDLKTSKGVFLGHKLQMTGYEGCRVECGMPKTEQQLVVRVSDDGKYEVVAADTTWDDFLTVLKVARLTKEKG